MKPEPAVRISDKTRTAMLADGSVIPVVDAKKGFMIRVKQEHIDLAVPDDPGRCMYALSAKEEFGSEAVWVIRSRAYIEMKTPAGTSELIRCIVPEIARRYMKANDLNLKTEIKPHNAFFRAPTVSQSLDYIRVSKQKSNQTLAQKRRAAAAARKAAELKALTRAEQFVRKPSLPIPVPVSFESFEPKPQPAKSKPERKKQDPTTGWEHARDGRGLWRF
jgi:hypothetical protein